jgi:hypothetical protein
MFGYESIIGVSALMGTKRSLNRVYTQIPGYVYSCTVEMESLLSASPLNAPCLDTPRNRGPASIFAAEAHSCTARTGQVLGCTPRDIAIGEVRQASFLSSLFPCS